MTTTKKPSAGKAAGGRPPSKAEAADFLRELGKMLAIYHEWSPEKRAVKDEQLRQALGIVADCIEKKVHWRKGSTLPMKQLALLQAVAAWNAPTGVTLTAHLTDLAGILANQWGWRGPDDVERVRDLIIEARKKRQRRGK